jgi:hypothetical protein
MVSICERWKEARRENRDSYRGIHALAQLRLEGSAAFGVVSLRSPAVCKRNRQQLISRQLRIREKDVLSMVDMTVTQGFCSFWLGRRTRRWLMVFRRSGFNRVEMLPLGAMAERKYRYVSSA